MAESMAEAMHVLDDSAWRALLRKHHHALRTGILVVHILPTLRPLLTELEYSSVEGKEGNVDCVDELVKILLTKDDSTFDGFCSALEKNGLHHMAWKLRGQGMFTQYEHLKEYIFMDVCFRLWLVNLAARWVLHAQSVYQWEHRLACMAFACTKYVLTKEYTAVCFILRCGYLAALWILQLVHWWMCCSVRITIVCSRCVLMKVLMVVYFTVGLVYLVAHWALIAASIPPVCDWFGGLCEHPLQAHKSIHGSLLHSGIYPLSCWLGPAVVVPLFVLFVCLLCVCPPLGMGYLTAKYICQWRRKRSAASDEATLKKMGVAPASLPSDIVDKTDDEFLLQQLCYMGTGINKLIIGPEGGSFILGSGDASLEFPSGAVEKMTTVRYAIVLYGPFVFPAGYMPGSVVVYINMDGATLVKPVQLYISHWCIREEGDDKDTLKCISAPHTLEAGQQKYVFEEQEEEDADFTTRTNVGILAIRYPHCLFCVETTSETSARYSAITFTKYIPSEDMLLFRIQIMCDSLEWNEKLTSTLQQKKWRKTCASDNVIQFHYAADHKQITASPQQTAGPGWEAAINGLQAVTDQLFLAPLRKCKEEIVREVNNGRFPPCILYQIIYTSPEEKRVKPALMRVELHGANAPLVFCCRLKEELSSTVPVSPATSGPVRGPVTPSSSIVPVTTRDVLKHLNHKLDAKWQHFGTHLGVEYQIMAAIRRDKGGNPEDCMLDLLAKWTSKQAGTGNLPRSWQTVVEAVQCTGDEGLAHILALKHKVTLYSTVSYY